MLDLKKHSSVFGRSDCRGIECFEGSQMARFHIQPSHSQYRLFRYFNGRFFCPISRY